MHKKKKRKEKKKLPPHTAQVTAEGLVFSVSGPLFSVRLFCHGQLTPKCCYLRYVTVGEPV
jgi:hypothetical protein